MSAAEHGLGWVSLVSAGPGDPELLTLKAVHRLRQASLVLYDALVDRRTLHHAKMARTFYVGKRSGRPSIMQSDIERMMIRAARRGEHVVRLKGGDAFVLGRGGEEALALADAGIPFEIISGVSSAAAAPATAGVPVTHRGIASAFIVVSGHDQAVLQLQLAPLAPNSLTVVVMMGLQTRAMLCDTLLNAGWAPKTPCAMVLAATTEHSQRWFGQLSELAHAPIETKSASLPGTIIVGDVVGVGKKIAPMIDRSAQLFTQSADESLRPLRQTAAR